MNLTAQLTKRESEVAEYLAWGASKKEVPDLLPVKPGRNPISVRTVEVITKSIYEKLRIQKVNELSVWYFCTHFNISIDLSPIKKQLVTAMLLTVLFVAEVSTNNDFVRPIRARASRTLTRSGKKTKNEDNTYEFPIL